jgi:Na+-transporting methylmalonyl-CoA/oxaloacetate decarboxylase gamma subunit
MNIQTLETVALVLSIIALLIYIISSFVRR